MNLVNELRVKAKEADLEINLVKTKILIKTAREDEDRTINSKDEVETIIQTTYLGQQLSNICAKSNNYIDKKFIIILA